jgi:nitrogen fixation protein NifT
MKVTIRKVKDAWQVYVPKKDLEAAVTEVEKPGLWGGTIKLDNGWTLEMPDMAADTPLPITVEARKVGE